MISPLTFLKQIQSDSPPPVVHLCGDDEWLRETIVSRIVSTWCRTDDGSQQVERLVGTAGIPELGKSMGSGSLFAEKKVILLTDPGVGEKGNPLSGMGKNQITELEKSVRRMPRELNRLVIVTGPMKKTSAVLKRLSGFSVQVDVDTPEGPARGEWVQLLAKRTGVRLSSEVREALTASAAPLRAVYADLEKLSLATPEGSEADFETWRNLSQVDPQATVWEIGDHLGRGQVGKALEGLRILESHGLTIHEILPALLSWNQQRLRVKSFSESGSGGTIEGIPPFVIKKIRPQVTRKTLQELRREAEDLLYLDRCTKQSWENPKIALEKFLVKTAVSGGKR